MDHGRFLKSSWYRVNLTGWLATLLYSALVVLFLYLLGQEIFVSWDFNFKITMVSMLIPVFGMLRTYDTGERPFQRKKFSGHQGSGGFSLIELLIVISIIGILSSITLTPLLGVRDKAYFAKAKEELRSVDESVSFYLEDFGTYPADANRDVPPGLEAYLAQGIWPDSAWPGSVFDWENWPPSALSYDPKEQVYQISIRFCPLGGGIETCKFPKASWADDFDQQSAVYYCISGPCRSHSSKPLDHPGYCVNCSDE